VTVRSFAYSFLWRGQRHYRKLLWVSFWLYIINRGTWPGWSGHLATWESRGSSTTAWTEDPCLSTSWIHH
jgi:hypothetical protein